MPRLRRVVAASILGALALAVGASAHAQDQLVPRPPRITPPGRSLAGTDDSDSIALNPAQIAFMPSWELRYTHVEVPSSSSTLVPGRGDAVGFALPLFFGFSTGLRFESIRPPSRSLLPPMTAIAWSLAFKLGDTLSYAIDIRRWGSTELDAIDGATSISLASAYRPSRYLGFALVARDLNAPRGRLFGPDAHIQRSFDFGLALRPTGTRALELGLESSFYPQAGKGNLWSPRATLGIDVPYVGRFTSAFQVADPTPFSTSSPGEDSFKNSWTVTAGVELGLVKYRLGGGVIAGPGLDAKGPGWYATASIAGFKAPGVSETSRAVTIRIEDTPGSRGHVRLLRKLGRLGRDPTVRAVALIMKSEPASSTAHAEELADALATLQAKGIRVLCHFEDGGGKALLACATADRILVNPAGGLRFAGLRSQTMYFGEALHKIGIEPDFLRIQKHKSAPEAFVRDGPTPVADADHKEFLREVEAVYLGRIAGGRHLTVETVRANIAKGPFVADEAIAAGFADAKSFDDEINRHIRQVVGDVIRIDEDEPEPQAPKTFGKQPRIAVVYIDGDIVDGRSQKIPLLGTKMVGSYTIAETLEAVRKDPSVKGVVLRIESPGGSSLASDVMWREAELLSKAKPVVVSMGSVAASGGYYAAAFGAQIYASAATVTGSIGIFYGKADVSPLLTKLGIHVVTDKTAPRADAESLYRPFTDEERIELGKKVAQFYAVFLDRVARGRKMTVDQVDAVGRGKVWLGRAAKEHGLVDVIGGFDQAFYALRMQTGLPPDCAVAEYPAEKGGLLDIVLDLMGAEAPVPQVAALPKAIAPYADALAPFAVYAADQPLALYEGIGAP